MTKLIIYYTEVNNWKWYFLRMQQVTQKINGTKNNKICNNNNN